MNLIQRGTTASRANRGKSVKNSIAQRFGRGGYESNWSAANLTQTIFFGMYSENDTSTHLTGLGHKWKVMIANQTILG